MDDRSTPSPTTARICDVLIIGAGYVGRHLCAQLGNSQTITAVVSSTASADLLRAQGVHALSIDLDSPPADLGSLLPAARAIVYLAPPPHAGRSDPRLAHCLEQLDTAPEVFVYMSTTGVYGDARGAVVDESAPLRPATDRAHRRVDAERAMQAWCAARGSRAVILRVPGIYGPHRLPLDRLRQGEPAVRREDAPIGNRIHVDDLALACRIAVEHPGARGPYNLCDGNPLSPADFLDTVADLAGLPRPPKLTLAAARQQFSAQRLSFLEEQRLIDASRARHELGWQPRFTDPADGIRASFGN